MISVLQTIDADIGTTNKPLRLQSAAKYRNWKQMMENFIYITYNLWNSFTNGPYSSQVVAAEGGTNIPKDILN
ncbi:hypothetical protein L1987_55827 [Smallanthus sonchifolius]|uniref:Uncharacterized protein n=1 Tax=Smallanthus sonchifolius TaxID=185202 RepID=A0ACB9EAY8_9ASTR|nr:hypothetical protein L1987_55827 [Smallanthus sonchifolius]